MFGTPVSAAWQMRRMVLERSWLLNEVWAIDFPNSLEVYIGYLRRKTEADGEPRLLHTVRGVGYVLRERPLLARDDVCRGTTHSARHPHRDDGADLPWRQNR